MLAVLLLITTQTAQAPAASTTTPAVRMLLDQRDSMPAGEFAQKLEALAASDAVAAELLGEALMFGGLGLPLDPPRACQWFERGAGKRGDATHNLALCFEQGNGRPQDLARSRVLYAQAAELGWVQAKCALGNLLVRGQGGPVDAAQGVRLCKEAAETGNANAQTDYANYLLMGEAVPRDIVAARRWYTAAAEQNQPNAALVLGQIYWKGDGVAADPAAAERWWRVAHDHGRADAAGLMVRAVFKRMITERDGEKVVDRSMLPEAVQWLEIAAEKDPDPTQRVRFAETLKTLTAGK